MALWFLLWLSVGDGTWWLVALNHWAANLFLPLPFLAISSLLLRQYKLILPLFIPVLILVFLYHTYLIPKSIPAGAPALSVMNYNVLYSNRDYESVANTILIYKPDFVALQEVRPRMMAELERRLAGVYPYSLLGDEHPYGTTAVFSRLPISDGYVLDLQADRSAVVIKTKLKGTDLTFISAHLLAYGLQWVPVPELPRKIMQYNSAQNREAQILIEESQEQTGIVILACDCNSRETSSSYRLLASSLTHAGHVTGWLWGDPLADNVHPDTDWQHIDYVFYQGPVRPLGVYVSQESGGSDHFPLLAYFQH